MFKLAYCVWSCANFVSRVCNCVDNAAENACMHGDFEDDLQNARHA